MILDIVLLMILWEIAVWSVITSHLLSMVLNILFSCELSSAWLLEGCANEILDNKFELNDWKSY